MIGKVLGILAVLPTIVLLAISFFVMVVASKIEESPLKSFGRVIAILLCITALFIFTMGMYVVAAGRCPTVRMIGKCGVPQTYDGMRYEKMCKPMSDKSLYRVRAAK